MGKKKFTVYDYMKSAVMGDEDCDDLKDNQFTKDLKSFYNDITERKDFKSFGDLVKILIQSEKVALDFIERDAEAKFVDIEFRDRVTLAQHTIEHNIKSITQADEVEEDYDEQI